MDFQKERFNHDEAIKLLRLEKDLDLIRNANRRLICAIRFENYDRIIALANEIIYRAMVIKEARNESRNHE